MCGDHLIAVCVTVWILCQRPVRQRPTVPGQTKQRGTEPRRQPESADQGAGLRETTPRRRRLSVRLRCKYRTLLYRHIELAALHFINIFTTRHTQGAACSGFKNPPAISSWVYPHTYVPVSYTHLDVYKRQVLTGTKYNIVVCIKLLVELLLLLFYCQ